MNTYDSTKCDICGELMPGAIRVNNRYHASCYLEQYEKVQAVRAEVRNKRGELYG